MDFFAVNKEFDNLEEVMLEKKEYESQNKVILIIRDSRMIKGEGELVKRMKYSRLSLHCKAGKERPTEGKGLRKSATLKKNCPMKVG